MWHLPTRQSIRVFTWARMWRSVVICRSQMGPASNKVWDTLTHINISRMAVTHILSSADTEAVRWTRLWVTFTHSLKHILPFSSTFSARSMQNFEIMACLSWSAYLNIFFSQFQNFNFKVKSNCKANPLQAWSGPEGSGRIRLPNFMKIGTWI
jgi:hypothetical protein